MKALTVAQMKMVEKNSDALGVSYLELMENAGVGSARRIIQKYPVLNKSVTILCGSGNNGGDGFVIARKLYEKGANVTVILCQGEPSTRDASTMYQKIKDLNIDLLDAEHELTLALFKIKQADIIVDTLFGTGFHGEITGISAQIIDRANHSFGTKVAVDIPSGISGDNGKHAVVWFHADCTLALGAYKKAHEISESREKCGELELIDIGIPDEAYDGLELDVIDLNQAMIRAMLPERDPDSNKGSYGKLLNIAGSVGMGGAALMCTQAALRSGAGLVTLAAPRCIIQSGFPHIMEATGMPLPESPEGTISEKCRFDLSGKLNQMSACVLGCGLGQNEGVTRLVSHLIQESQVPMVLDADGLNSVASGINPETQCIDIIKEAQCNLILTPHPGEMARLTGMTITQIQSNRVKTAHDFAVKYQVTLVLKGHNTIVALPDGSVYRNPTGNAGMARGGSGDILAGMIGAFLAQGFGERNAALLGVYLHGLAGDLCAEQYTQYAMTAGDLIRFIPEAFEQVLSM
ncbi:MAG: NAD(P)H-hydrate dehydratase [Massiliimalia sp.]